MYIHLLKTWPQFNWETEEILPLLGKVRSKQGMVLGQMVASGFKVREDALLDALTLDVTKSSEIEGEDLNNLQVRSSIAKRLGIAFVGAVPVERHIEGVVEMMLDATQNYETALTEDRLCSWQAALFPTGRSGMEKLTVGAYRTPEAGPMQVVSGPMGKKRVHFEAPKSERIAVEMEKFITWFNNAPTTDAVIKAAIAHLWFVTIHPFDDGNGRITRALTDLLLARADESKLRFYSMSAEILKERNAYYKILEDTQKGGLDITGWLKWFLNTLLKSIKVTLASFESIKERNLFWETHRDTPLNVRQQHMINSLQEDFFGKLTTIKWAKITKSSPDTALRDINDLIVKNILIKEPPGGRSTSYTLISKLK